MPSGFTRWGVVACTRDRWSEEFDGEDTGNMESMPRLGFGSKGGHHNRLALANEQHRRPSSHVRPTRVPPDSFCFTLSRLAHEGARESVAGLQAGRGDAF
jgi:hypothetical protein